MEPSIRVLIAADDPLAGTGLVTILETEEMLTVVGRISGDSLLASELAIYRPDVVLLDLGWPYPDEGTLIQPKMQEALIDRETPLVVLVSTPDQAAAVWGLGIRALLLRDASVAQLRAALSAAAESLVVLDERLVESLAPLQPFSVEEPEEPLTAREMEVLLLIAEGFSNKAIALALAISEHTVKFHINSLMGKLNAQSRTDAVVKATRSGLISL
jgi:DNA-binding NarL/FixJ family response regulator